MCVCAHKHVLPCPESVRCSVILWRARAIYVVEIQILSWICWALSTTLRSSIRLLPDDSLLVRVFVKSSHMEQNSNKVLSFRHWEITIACKTKLRYFSKFYASLIGAWKPYVESARSFQHTKEQSELEYLTHQIGCGWSCDCEKYHYSVSEDCELKSNQA